MSTTIDQRVVEMRFDNKNFESNVQTSLSTLEKLKQSLNLTGASKGLDGIGKAAKNVDFSPMADSAGKVANVISHQWATLQHQINRYVDRLVDSAERAVKALTIQPITTGLQEYETQINSVQTILANTESKGTNIDDVNAALDELNTYADKTIYNFTEMTRNIGTFTAAGVDLDKSVTSIKGIANLAAVSGSTSQQASTAMYQLSQALAAGKVQLMDWNSVVNAGMGGQVFQDALKRTAKQMGTNVDDLIKKYGSFRESLTQGEWLTAEVLTETLTQLSGAYSKADLIAQGYTESQAEEITKLAKTAVDAATKVKTATQLWDTLKEAAQSGWTQTWELIIGDFEEAKELWTKVSDVIGKFINDMSESRNTLLADALNSPWEKLIGKINEAGIETSMFEERVRAVAKDNGVNVDELVTKYGSFEKACRSGSISSDIFNEALKNLGGTTADLSKITGELKMGAVGEDVKQAQEALKGLGYDLGKAGADGVFGAATESAIKAFQETKGLEITGIIDEATLNALKEANTNVTDLTESCGGLIGQLDEFGGREMLIQSFANVFKSVTNILRQVKYAFRDVFPKATGDDLKSLIIGFRDFTATLKPSMKTMTRVRETFRGLFSVIDIGLSFFKAIGGGIVSLLSNFTGLSGGLLGITAGIGKWLSSLRDSVKETNIFTTVVNKIVGAISNVINWVKQLGVSFKESFKTPEGASGIFGFFISLWNIIKTVGTSIITTVGSISTTIAEAFGKGDIFEVFNSGLIAGIGISISKFVKSLGDGFDNVGGFLENITGTLEDVRGCMQAYQDQLKAGTLMKIASAIALLAAAIFVISTIDADKLAQALGAITVLFGELLGSLAIFNKIGGSFKGTLKAIPLMVALSASILILAAAMKVISGISWEGIAKGLVAIGALMAELSIFLSTAKFSGKMFGTALGIVLLSSAMVILAKAVKDFGSMNWGEIGKGLAAIGALLLEISLFTKLTGNSKKVLATGAAMVLLGASMKIFASAMIDFAKLKWDDIGRGLVAMGGALAEVAIAMKLMPKGSIFNAAGLIVAAAALKIMFTALSDFSGMSWDQIGRGMVAMGGALLELSIGLNLMKGTISGSFALLIASAALAVIAPVLQNLGKLSWEQIGKGLVALAGAFVIIGVAGALLTPLIPTLLGLGAAILVLGVGVAAIGAGLVMIGAGISSIAASLAVGGISIVAGISSIILGLLNLVPEIVQIIGNVILGVAAVLGDYAPQLAESLCKLLVSAVESLATYAPQLVNSLLVLLIEVIDGLAEHIPTLIQSFANLLGKVFKGVVDAFKDFDTGSLLKGVAAVGLMAIVARLLSGMMSVLPSAMIGLVAVGILIAELALVLAAVGQLAKIPGVEDGIAKAGDILNGIGKAIGKFIGGIGEGLTESLVDIGQNIADFMEKLATASDNAKGVDATAFDGVAKLIEVMGSIALTTVGTSISDIFTLGGTSMEKFQTDGVAFFDAMRAISQASTGIALDEASIGAVITTATKLSELQSSLEPIGGVMDFFTGRDDLATFGINCGAFILAMKTALGTLDGVEINSEAIGSIVTAATSLSLLQSSLEPIGGVISWFTGRDDLATFGVNCGSFISSMSTALSSVGDATFNSEALTSIVDAATKLSGLQSSLESIGGVVDWFTGRDDLATFGTNVASFIGSMVTALSSLSDVTFNQEALTAIITAATQLSGLQSSLENIGGVVDWFTGKDDLGTFGTNVASFIGSMVTAFSSLGDTPINSEAMTSVIDAATKLSGLQSSLENMGGVIDWFTGASDLGTFGTKIGEFATAMGTLRDNMGESGISQEVITSITNTGAALVALNDTLPEKGWFDKKEDLTDFSTHITSFAEAIASFSATASTLNADGITVAMDTANKMKELISNIADLDTSGVAEFTGVGKGGVGADGPISDIATAMSDFSTKVSGIDTAAVSTASSSALRLKTLINGLVDLDTSGISKFKPESIGIAMKSYMDKVSGMDTGAVSASITMANRLKNFINGLAGLDTSGVSSFISAITDLCSIDIGDFKVPDLSTLGSDLIDSIISGITTKSTDMSTSMSTTVSNALQIVTDSLSDFKSSGTSIMLSLIEGIKSKISMVTVPITTAISSAVMAISVHKANFRTAGGWLGDGLIEGINSKKQAAYDAGYALGQKAVEGEKDGQQSKSPSKLTEQAGEWLGEGLVIGMNNMVKTVYSTGKNLGKTAADSMTNTASRIAAAINTDIDTQPTIRPVLDLSNIENGAGTIGNLLNGTTVGVSTNIGAISTMMNRRSQNGTNADVVSAINDLNKHLNNLGNTTYQVNGITYDDGSAISDAVSSLIRATRVEGRI